MKFGALTQFKAKNLDKGKHSDGQGLWLWKSSKVRGQWVLRLVVQGRRREMGLGGWPEVGIAEAREHAANARKLLRSGVDPIEARRKMRQPVERFTLEQAINGCFEARQAELKGDGMAGRWMSPLSVHVIPQIGSTPVEDIDQHILHDRFAPIWHDKPSAAAKALSRVNLSLKHAAALGLNVDLQAVMKTKALLGKQRHTPTHIASIPYNDAPEFYRFLTTKDAMSALALRLLTLTCARSGEIRLATRDEINGNIWTIPADRTKQGKEHRVPLSSESMAVIKLATNQHNHAHLFPTRSGKPMSDAAMAKFMKNNGYKATPHGLRSTFRSWAEERTDAEWAVKELSLGHTVGGKVERAYMRSDLLEKRKALLDHWSAFLLKNHNQKSD